MSKTCIFCDDRADSNEDVWPKWVLRLLRKSDTERVPMRTRRIHEEPREYMTADTALKVGNVCGRCNSGWMSQLENGIMPIFSPMVMGTSVSLTASQQTQIAVWLTKTAMMYDSMDKGEVFYDGLDRQHFRKSVSPLSDTYAWLGYYSENSSLRGSVFHQTLRISLSSGNSCKMHLLTMNIGCLIGQIASVKRLAHIDLATTIDFQTSGPNLTDALVQVWPVNLRDVEWPPALDINTDRLKALAHRFGGEKV